MKLIGNSVEISMIYLLESIENLVEMDIHWKSTEISMKNHWVSFGNPVDISMKFQWKLIGYPVEISMTYLLKSLGNLVEIQLEMQLEIHL